MLLAQHAGRPPAAPCGAVTLSEAATVVVSRQRPQDWPDRRRALLSLLGYTTVVAVQQLSAGKPALADESLCSRLDSPAATIRNPGGAKPWAAKQIYYPVSRLAMPMTACSFALHSAVRSCASVLLQEWLFGEWDVQQRFIGFRTPLGYEYVPAWAQASAQARLCSLHKRLSRRCSVTLRQGSISVQTSLVQHTSKLLLLNHLSAIYPLSAVGVSGGGWGRLHHRVRHALLLNASRYLCQQLQDERGHAAERCHHRRQSIQHCGRG